MSEQQNTPGRSDNPSDRDDRTPRTPNDPFRDEQDETSGRHAAPRTGEDHSTGGGSGKNREHDH